MSYKYVQRWSASPPHYNIHLFLCLELWSHYSCHALHLHTVGLHNPILADFLKFWHRLLNFPHPEAPVQTLCGVVFKEKCRSCLHCGFTAQILQKVPESNLLSVWTSDLIFSPRLILWFYSSLKKKSNFQGTEHVSVPFYDINLDMCVFCSDVIE